MPVALKLSKRFYEAFGEQVANEFVDALNLVDATYRSELRDLNESNFARSEAKQDARFAQFEQRWAQFDAKTEQRFAQFEQRWAQFDAKTEQRFARFEQRWAQFDAKTEQRFAQFEQRWAQFDAKTEQRFAQFEVRIVKLIDERARQLYTFTLLGWGTTIAAVIGSAMAFR